MKTEITTKELEEAMNAVLKQARKMEDLHRILQRHSTEATPSCS